MRNGVRVTTLLIALLTFAPGGARAQGAADTLVRVVAAPADTSAPAPAPAGVADSARATGRVAPAEAPASAASDAPNRRITTGPGHWFYSGLPYGSEALLNPLRVIINGGLGILQSDSRNNRLSELHTHAGLSRVWADMTHPVRAIEVGGWGDWIERELIPMSANKYNAQYWPNYTNHLFGGGMTYVMLREWYATHGVGRPGAASIGTMAVYHFLNEIVENQDYAGPTTDAISDLYVFDPAAILLFSHEGVCGFFSRRLHLRDWPGQPSINPSTLAIENPGENYSVKLALPRTDHWSLFYYFGNHGEGGLTYTKDNGSAFSLGGGLVAKALIEIGRGEKTVDLAPSYGFFYDRNGSLLFSLSGANTSRYRLRLNVYPGLLHVKGRTAGLFLMWCRNDEFVGGVTVTWLPVGLAGRR